MTITYSNEFRPNALVTQDADRKAEDKLTSDLTEFVTTESRVDGGMGPTGEFVEGLPLPLVERYAALAARHGIVRQVDPGVYFASVVGLDGAFGDGDSVETALDSLRQAIVGWVAVKRRVGARDIPPIEGLDVNIGDQT